MAIPLHAEPVSPDAPACLRVAGRESPTLHLDGKVVGALPQEICNLAAGPHSIRVEGTNRQEELSFAVSLRAGETRTLEVPPLKFVKGRIVVELRTPGAKVYLVSSMKRVEVPIFPIAVELDLSYAWRLEATKPGYRAFEKPVIFPDRESDLSIDVVLVPVTAATSQPRP